MNSMYYIRKKITHITLVLFCIATAAVIGACANTRAPQILYNGSSYFICGIGERDILKKCGLPDDITEDLAGSFVSYLEPGPNNSYQLTEFENDTGMKLFEYGPEPNENVYIVLMDRHYCAAILHDSEGYHGLD